MLSKEVCKRCFNAEKEILRHWNVEYDEFNWKHGSVNCRAAIHRWIGDAGVSIQGNPPPECPFPLEHLLDTQDAE